MGESERERESIWSVPHGWKTGYFLTFSVSNLAATCLIVVDEVANRGDASPLAVFSSIAERVAVSGLALAITIFSVVEVSSFTMIVADYFRRKYLEPLKEKQREEGREQTQRLWEEWNDRRLKAEADGVPFTESPPELPRAKDEWNGPASV